MLKYLAGIFTNPRNDYANGRLSMPRPKKLPMIRPSPLTQSPQVKISKRNVINGGRLGNVRLKPENGGARRRSEGNPHLPRHHSLSSQKINKFGLDPISYIVNVADSTSSHDEESVLQLPNAAIKLKAARHRKQDYGHVIPPPVSRVPSWSGPLNANPFNNLDDQSNWKLDSIAGDEDTTGWDAICLPDEF
ncbi:uncharacterized protein LOC6551431 [Drosophila erecta]|uniref:Uncharacterized protein n=1 Tax=Drosophila erecta TaxID=7220 RepID=B3NUF0_DROER|nr:uncharacterized protein LOC6551431 [Drosophila erecta]EDV46065.1 uncharacterized protein Dere_GG18404 [Drosophila erecta]